MNASQADELITVMQDIAKSLSEIDIKLMHLIKIKSPGYE